MQASRAKSLCHSVVRLGLAGIIFIQLVVFLGVASCHTSPFVAVATLSGTTSVKDGDGVLFGEIEVRLRGIAAPENNEKKNEPGGLEATANLRNLVEGKSITCLLDGTLAPPGRPVGVCFLGDLEIGEYQVKTGYARDCPHYSKGQYTNAEQHARSLGRDLSRIYPLPDYCL